MLKLKSIRKGCNPLKQKQEILIMACDCSKTDKKPVEQKPEDKNVETLKKIEEEMVEVVDKGTEEGE